MFFKLLSKFKNIPCINKKLYGYGIAEKVIVSGRGG